MYNTNWSKATYHDQHNRKIIGIYELQYEKMTKIVKNNMKHKFSRNIKCGGQIKDEDGLEYKQHHRYHSELYERDSK